MSRAGVYVESLNSSQREAGEIIQALRTGAISGPDRLNTLSDLVHGRAPRPLEQPVVFKTTGMPWQDLALAAAVYVAYSSQDSDPAATWSGERARGHAG